MDKLRVFQRIVSNYPFVAYVYLLINLLKLIPIINIKHVRYKDNETKLAKEIRKTKKDYIGHFMEDREIIFSFSRLKLFTIKIHGLKQNNLLHFYLLRKTKIFYDDFYKKYLEMIEKESNILIFEPGCNTGKMLVFFKHKFNAQIIGADIDNASIEVANEICDKKDKFVCVDTVNSDFTKQFKDKEITLTVISSHLVHTLHYDNFNNYLNELIRISKYLIIHEIFNEELLNKLNNVDILNKNIVASDLHIKAFFIT